MIENTIERLVLVMFNRRRTGFVQGIVVGRVWYGVFMGRMLVVSEVVFELVVRILGQILIKGRIKGV